MNPNNISIKTLTIFLATFCSTFSILPLILENEAIAVIGILRPTNHIDNAGKTIDPESAYDNDLVTSADIATSYDYYPSVTYYTWGTSSTSYSSLVLNISRSSSGHIDDKWGIKYSKNGGNSWISLDYMSPRNEASTTVSVDLDLSQDLSKLQVRIDTDKIKKSDNGHVTIYDIWTEGVLYEPPTLEQSAYRFFSNIDSVDLSAIVSDVSGVDEANDIAIDDDHMYVVGFEPGKWRIEKRRLDNGDLAYSVTSYSNGHANAIAIDSDHMYVVGSDYFEGHYKWRIEKRYLSDLSLVVEFGDGGVIISDPSDDNDSANAIAIDSNHMYVVGSDQSQGASDTQWRMEKRMLDDGTLVDEMVNNPSRDNDKPNAIAIDSDHMYVVGYDRIPGSSDKPGKGHKSSSNAEWRIEKRSLSDLSLLVAEGTSNPSEENSDVARDIAIDSDYMYIVGSKELGFFDTAWRIEKRYLSDLSFVDDFGDGGVITEDFGYDDQPSAIAIDGNHMYIAGHSATIMEPGDTAADTEWRIEKRGLTTGTLEYAIANDIYSNNNDRARAIAIDSSYLYAAGYDNPGLAEWRVEKRNLSDGSFGLLQPLTPLNTPTVLDNLDEFRLRILMHVESGTLLKNEQHFKLQLAEENPIGNCEDYEDVTNTTAIAFMDNLTPADGKALIGSTEDPSHNGHVTRNQTYEEMNNFTNSASTIIAGEDGMWDFPLYVNMTPLGTYCFRIVREDGTTPLNHYAVYPEVQILP